MLDTDPEANNSERESAEQQKPSKVPMQFIEDKTPRDEKVKFMKVSRKISLDNLEDTPTPSEGNVIDHTSVSKNTESAIESHVASSIKSVLSRQQL